METSEDVTRMRLVGGNLALDFVNSRVGPPGAPADDDVLTSYAALVAWGMYAGALTDDDGTALRSAAGADPLGARRAYGSALRLRDDLDEIVRDLVSGDAPASDVLARIRDTETEALRHAQLDPANGFAWTWQGDRGLRRPLWPVVHAAVQFLASDRRRRLKRCGGCSFVFVDDSKNHSRRWCSMEDCGTAEKTRRYIAARRARAKR
jgi:predicted RNA-binding Zn ribbon-like protein